MKNYVFIVFLFFTVSSCTHSLFSMKNHKKTAKKRKKRRNQKNKMKPTLFDAHNKLIAACIKNDVKLFGDSMSLGARADGIYNPFLVNKFYGIKSVTLYYDPNIKRFTPFNGVIGSYSTENNEGGCLIEKREKNKRFAITQLLNKKIIDIDIFIAIMNKLKDSKKEFYTPIHIAAKSNSSWIVQTLLRKNVSVHSDCWKNYPELKVFGEKVELKWFNYPLHRAVKSKNLELVKKFIERGAEVNSVNQHGYTPLYIANKIGCLSVINFLRINGAKIDQKGMLEETIY